jgi:hypothetical protein
VRCRWLATPPDCDWPFRPASGAPEHFLSRKRLPLGRSESLKFRLLSGIHRRCHCANASPALRKLSVSDKRNKASAEARWQENRATEPQLVISAQCAAREQKGSDADGPRRQSQKRSAGIGVIVSPVSHRQIALLRSMRHLRVYTHEQTTAFVQLSLKRCGSAVRSGGAGSRATLRRAWGYSTEVSRLPERH